MKRRRFREEQIVGILKEHHAASSASTRAHPAVENLEHRASRSARHRRHA